MLALAVTPPCYVDYAMLPRNAISAAYANKRAMLPCAVAAAGG